MVPGYAINNNFSVKGVGGTDSVKGKLDNYQYVIFCLKYYNYVLRILSTFYGFIYYPSQKVSTCSLVKISGESKTEKFKHKIPF